MAAKLLVGGEIILYGDVGADDSIFSFGEGFTPREVTEALAELKGQTEIVVRINSGGGKAFDGITIYNLLKSNASKIKVFIDGLAASAASVIAMAGDVRVMMPGSSIMIHNPSGMTAGDADAHEAAVESLRVIEKQAAEIYSSVSGASVDKVLELMAAETWLSADEAFELGFATEVFQYEENKEMSTNTARINKVLLETIQMSAKAKRSMESEEEEPENEEGEEDEEEPTQRMEGDEEEPTQEEDEEPTQEEDEEPTQKKKAVRQSTRSDVGTKIFNACMKVGLSKKQMKNVITKAGGNLSRANSLIIAELASRDPGAASPRRPATVVADARDKFVLGATKGLMARVGMTGGERNQFTGMTLREMAQESLTHIGINKRFSDPMVMIKAAMAPLTMGLRFVPRMDGTGMHSTSDFVEIMANVANKSMLIGYEEAGETFEAWTSKGTLSDFKPTKRIDLNVFPSLASVPEGAEYKNVSIGDRGVSAQLATYGNMFSITRQSIINDDLSVFSKIPNRMGRAAHRTIGDLVYAVLTANAAMADGIALFHADHANFQGTGTAITVDSVDEARVMMAKQRDPDNNAIALNIRPAFLLVPVELEGTATVLMAAQYEPTDGMFQKPNKVSGLAKVVSDARLSLNDSGRWYMAASPTSTDTVEVSYLNGNSTPYMEQQDGWRIDGVEYKIRIDAAVTVLDYRGLFMNDGEGG